MSKLLTNNGYYTFFRYTITGPLTGNYPTEYTGSHHSAHQRGIKAIGKQLRETWKGHRISGIVVTQCYHSNRPVYAGDTY